MKNGILLSVTLTVIVAGFFLVFYRREESSDITGRKKGPSRGTYVDEIRSTGDGNARKAKTAAKASNKPGAAMTPEQQEAEKQRLARLAEARAVFEAAVAANDPAAVAGRDFLAAHSKLPGVQVTDSGLQFELRVTGLGPIPAPTDSVKVHYHGTFPDGTVFDSSTDRGEPATFPLSGVVAGWTEGLQLMPQGSKFKFTIPSYLAYGDHEMPIIPAHSVLIFEIELLEVVPR